MKRTDIEWTDLSSNPLQYRDAAGKVVWACVKHSAGCLNCYSEAIAQRFHRGRPFVRANMEGLTPFLAEEELRHILTAQTVGKRPVAGCRCFLGDMTDVFGDWVPDELLDRLFAAIALRPDVTFQVLTKRADRMARYFADLTPGSARVMAIRQATGAYTSFVTGPPEAICFPLPNLWLGVSTENQAAAIARIPHLVATPAAVRFLSMEPLLGPVDLTHVKFPTGAVENVLRCDASERLRRCGIEKLNGIDWVILGGESGPGARSLRVEWVREIVRQCKGAGTPAFVKQLGRGVVCRNDSFGGWDETQWPQYLDPERVEEHIHGFREDYQGADVRVRLNDRAGGDPAEWPEDLRVREFPDVRV